MEDFPKNNQEIKSTQQPNYEYHVIPETEAAELGYELIKNLDVLKKKANNPNISPEDRKTAQTILSSMEAEYEDLIKILSEADEKMIKALQERGEKVTKAAEEKAIVAAA